MDISLQPRKVSNFFALIVMCLTLAQITLQFASLYFGLNAVPRTLVILFNFEGEKNFPAMYSAVALLFCSALLALITYAKKKSGAPYYIQWAGLALIFLLLSVDEMIGIHERVSRLLRPFFDSSDDPIYFMTWMIPYGIVGIILLWMYVNFLRHLPPKTRTLFIISGVIFVLGAVGLEVVAGLHNYSYEWTREKSRTDIVYAAIVTVKEFLEMAGIVVFIYALMAYIGSEFNELRLKIA